MREIKFKARLLYGKNEIKEIAIIDFANGFVEYADGGHDRLERIELLQYIGLKGDQKMNNRIYKFRAWDNINKCMLYNVGVVDSKVFCFEKHNKNNMEHLIEIKPEIMQYTGLKDKNGREIYKWDILKDNSGDINLIKYGEWDNGESYNDWNSGYGWYCQEYFKGTTNKTCVKNISRQLMKELEVIGNLSENPELMEEK